MGRVGQTTGSAAVALGKPPKQSGRGDHRRRWGRRLGPGRKVLPLRHLALDLGDGDAGRQREAVQVQPAPAVDGQRGGRLTRGGHPGLRPTQDTGDGGGGEDGGGLVRLLLAQLPLQLLLLLLAQLLVVLGDSGNEVDAGVRHLLDLAVDEGVQQLVLSRSRRRLVGPLRRLPVLHRDRHQWLVGPGGILHPADRDHGLTGLALAGDGGRPGGGGLPVRREGEPGRRVGGVH